MASIVDVSPARTHTQIAITEDEQLAGGQSVSGKALCIAMSASGMRLYLGGHSGVWRSDDGGQRWTHLEHRQPPPGVILVLGALLPPAVYDLLILPSDPDVVLAATGGDTRRPRTDGIYRSADAGASWQRVHTFSDAVGTAIGTVGSLASAPDDERLMFAGGEFAVGVSTDGGLTWTESHPRAGQEVWYVGCGPQTGSVRRVYALGSRVWYSSDGGQTWDEDPIALSADKPTDGVGGGVGQCARCLCVDPIDPGTVYLALPHRELWRGRYPAAGGGPGEWTQLPVPPKDPYRTASGTNFAVVHRAPDGRRYLFYSDTRNVHISVGDPRSSADWSRIDPPPVHCDPHGLALTPDFAWAGVGGGAGRIVMVNDGGAVVSSNGAAAWETGSGLATLGLVNTAVLPRPDRTPGLVIQTGDNSGFFSADGGSNWRTQDYFADDNDCSFADPTQPHRLIVLAPRDGTRKIYLYTVPPGQIPNGGQGTGDRQTIPGPPPVDTTDNNSDDPRSQWNCISNFYNAGYRPLVLTLDGEASRPDGDFVTIWIDRGPFGSDQVPVAKLLRTTAMSTITRAEDWITTDRAEGPGVKAFQQGPDLPDPAIGVVQASGGHANPTFYVGDMTVGDLPGGQRVWKWRRGMASWQQIVPGTGQAAPSRAQRFFADPYRPALIYVLAPTSIHRSEDGGASWTVDQALQAAITENGAFPLNITYEQGINHTALLRDMVFHPTDPGWRVAVSLAGVFRTFNGQSWDHWLLSSAAATRPVNAVYDPRNRMLYVSTSNRGILRLGPPGAEGEFYTTDGRGDIHRLRLSEGWRRTWTAIIPGNFGGDGHTDRLFYDAQAGHGQFYTTDGQGHIHPLRLNEGWRRTLTAIIPGNFGGDGHTDRLFYDAQAGDGDFYTVDDTGGLHTIRRGDGSWRRTWTAIIPGNFGGDGHTDLLFYDPTARQSDQITSL